SPTCRTRRDDCRPDGPEGRRPPLRTIADPLLSRRSSWGGGPKRRPSTRRRRTPASVPPRRAPGIAPRGSSLASLRGRGGRAAGEAEDRGVHLHVHLDLREGDPEGLALALGS